ncbi:hypothetical protein [Streptomyces sp. NPDC002602]|uniref:hypothetical protein n=1 Tax=Streptomyces sp. NPDC002602 TaxID=3364654 RepID=UPI003680B7CC
MPGATRPGRPAPDALWPTQPDRVFEDVVVCRPGELMEIDSTPFDVLIRLENGVVDRVELTGLADIATRTIAAAVLQPTTKSVDAALLLARAVTLAPMRACVEQYRPGPPSLRPEPYAQVEWEWPKLRKAIDKVYGYRSERLHAGVPFPHPLCQEPMRSGSALDERPSGIAATASNAAWVAKDLPMHLHTFGHIVRGSLFNWWQASSGAPLDDAPGS